MRNASRKPLWVDRIRRELNSKIENTGRSLFEIADEADIPYPVLNRFKNRKRGLSLDTANRLAIYLGITLTIKEASPL